MFLDWWRDEGWRRVHGTQLELSQSALHLHLHPWRQQLAADVSSRRLFLTLVCRTAEENKNIINSHPEQRKEVCLRRGAGAVALVPGREG